MRPQTQWTTARKDSFSVNNTKENNARWSIQHKCNAIRVFNKITTQVQYSLQVQVSVTTLWWQVGCSIMIICIKNIFCEILVRNAKAQKSFHPTLILELVNLRCKVVVSLPCIKFSSHTLAGIRYFLLIPR